MARQFPRMCLVLAVAACTTNGAVPTEIVVVVSSEYAPGAELARVVVTTSDASGATIGTHDFAIASAPSATAVTTPFSFETHPTGDDARPLRIRLEAYARDATTPFLTRRATAPWVRGERRRLTLVLSRACASIACPSTDQTCIGGACADSAVSVAALDPIRPGEELTLDAGTLVLADGAACRGGAGCSDATHVEVGRGFACALRASGHVACWGDQAALGQLGNGVTNASSAPVEVAGVRGATALVIGDAFACVASETTASCWGANDLGQLARNPADASSATPAAIAAFAPGPLLFAAASTGCASRGGAPSCWGGPLAPFAALPDTCAAAPCARTPIEQPSFGAIAALSDEGHLCVVRDGRLSCVGANQYGEVGDGTRDARTALTDAIALAHVWSVATTPRSTCAVDARLIPDTDMVTSALHCWGADDLGQLGDSGAATTRCVGDAVCAPMPSPALAAITEPIEVSATGDTICVREASGRVLCWGSDANGGLGDGSGSPDHCGATPCARAPTLVRNLSDAIDLDARAGTFCAVRRNGNVVCWGLGHSDFPVDVGPLPR